MPNTYFKLFIKSPSHTIEGYSATQSALNSVARILLEGHMKTCVLEKIQEGDMEILDEVMVTIQKLMKK